MKKLSIIKCIFAAGAALICAACAGLFLFSPYLALALMLLGVAVTFLSASKLFKLAQNDTYMRGAAILWFAAYLLLLADFTLLNSEFLRNGQLFSGWSLEAVAEYAKTHLLLEPFGSVRYFLGGFVDGTVGFKWMILNIGGNLAAFMPFAFFLPYFFKSVRSALRFVGAVLLAVAVVEILQIMLMTGYADVDDFILNALGALLAYLIINSRSARRILAKSGLNFASNKTPMEN